MVINNIFFEKGLTLKKQFENELLKSWENENNSDKDKIKALRESSHENLNKAIKQFEKDLRKEPENELIIEQLAQAYLNNAVVGPDENKDEQLERVIVLMDKLIMNQSGHLEYGKNINLTILLAMAFAKLYVYHEALRIINIFIICKPEYFGGYYAKACIYSINGENNIEFLQFAYDNLIHAVTTPTANPKRIWQGLLRIKT